MTFRAVFLKSGYPTRRRRSIQSKFIKDNYHKSKWFLKYIQNIEEAEQDRKLVEFNLKDLYKQVYDQKRFDIITTVISDYDMPEITGLEMFSDLHDAQLQ